MVYTAARCKRSFSRTTWHVFRCHLLTVNLTAPSAGPDDTQHTSHLLQPSGLYLASHIIARLQGGSYTSVSVSRHSSSRNHILMSSYEAETLSSVDFSTATFYIFVLVFFSSLFNLEVALLFRRFLIDWLIDWLNYLNTPLTTRFNRTKTIRWYQWRWQI